MLLGLAFYLRYKPKYLRGIGDEPNRARAGGESRRRAPTAPLTRDERDRVLALLIIIACTIPFWMAFEQAGSSMNFFAAERTNRLIGGYMFPASWLQSVNSAVLISRRRSSPRSGRRSRVAGASRARRSR